MSLFKFTSGLVMILLASYGCFARQKATVSGYLKDAVSGESITGAVISVDGGEPYAVSDSYGFYSLTLDTGMYRLQFRSMGYRTEWRMTYLIRDTLLTVRMESSVNMMNEVMVSSSVTAKHSDKPVSVLPLSMNAVRQLPQFLGEADLIRSFQLLPGVSSTGEGATGFHVRGGGIDQNLVMIDEAPLYFTSHLLNLFSVANPDAIRDASLYRTEMPARFGSRLSSVLDVRMKDGNNQQWNFTGGLGLIASRLTAEGPIRKGKSSVIVSARRSYTDLITRQFSDPDISDNSIYFYDLSAKVNVTLSEKDRLFLSGYFGRDNIRASDMFMFRWENSTGTLRWNHIYNARLFSNTSIVASGYNYLLGNGNDATNSFAWRAGIHDYIVKSAWNWYPDPENTVFMGVEAALHEFSPGVAAPYGPQSLFIGTTTPGQRGAEYAAYWDHEVGIGDAFALEYGLRFSAFQSIARDSATVFDYEGEVGSRKRPVNPQVYRNWQSIRWYTNLQPRLSLKIRSGENASVKLSYSRTAQYLHLISNTISSSPLDIWMPSSYNIKPETADQFSSGYFLNAGNGRYEASVEVYYRRLYNQFDFIDGAETLLNNDLPGDMLFGEGRAYGTEWYIRKNSGRLNGWLSYTLSRTERKIEGINGGRYYPARYDKTHSMVLAAIYQLKTGVTLSGTWHYASGTPATLPSDRFLFQGYPVLYSSDGRRNNSRIPSYQRLDISATFRNRQPAEKRFRSEWVVSVFNALNRRNAFSVYMRQNENRPEDPEAVRFAMFGTIIPSVTWNFKF